MASEVDIFAELEQRFSRIPDDLRADWTHDMEGISWRIAGGTSFSRRQFEAEAIRAGDALPAGPDDSPKPFYRWLNCLRRRRFGLESPFDDRRVVAGPEPIYPLIGSIHNVVRESVLMCRRLQGHTFPLTIGDKLCQNRAGQSQINERGYVRPWPGCV